MSQAKRKRGSAPSNGKAQPPDSIFKDRRLDKTFSCQGASVERLLEEEKIVTACNFQFLLSNFYFPKRD